MALFNKNRKLSISGKRISRYLTYAVGEIILVVIGILIALYLNNERQKYVESKELELILDKVVYDMEKDLKNADLIIDTTKASRDLISKILFEETFKDSLRDCFDCRYLITETIPISLNRRGYNLLSTYNKDIKKQSKKIDSVMSFYNDYDVELFKLINSLVIDEVVENLKYMRDNHDWFSDYFFKGECSSTCKDYFVSQTYINRLTYYDLMANDNYIYTLQDYQENLKNMINYLNEKE